MRTSLALFNRPVLDLRVGADHNFFHGDTRIGLLCDDSPRFWPPSEGDGNALGVGNWAGYAGW